MKSSTFEPGLTMFLSQFHANTEGSVMNDSVEEILEAMCSTLLIATPTMTLLLVKSSL